MKKFTTKQFIEKAILKHGNKYHYDKSSYINRRTKLIIICPEHGDFHQEAGSHLHGGKGCPKCSLLTISKKVKLTTSEFIEKAKKVHGEKYDYDLVEYNGTKKHIKLRCKKHGIFSQVPNYHLSGHGCQKCNESWGERKIRDFLEVNGIEFQKEMMFENCKNIKHLEFDFYLPKENLIIEFDGRQHFMVVDRFNGEDGFQKTKENDRIKDEFAKNNGIDLLRISYLQYDDIEKILKNVIWQQAYIRA